MFVQGERRETERGKEEGTVQVSVTVGGRKGEGFLHPSAALLR